MLGLQNIVEPKGKDSHQKKEKYFTVAVEGNIGCGKSTFLEYFRKYDNVEVVTEPVSKWKDVNGHNTLEMMYKDASRWSLAFQSYVQLTMAECHRAETMHKGRGIKMMERSLFSAKNCFVENLHKSKLMPEVDFAILCEYYDWVTSKEELNVDLFIYLQAQPEICQERIQKRDRHEEKGVPLDYLYSLHKLHEEWLIEKKFKVPAPLIVVDANLDIADMYQKYEDVRNELLSKADISL